MEHKGACNPVAKVLNGRTCQGTTAEALEFMHMGGCHGEVGQPYLRRIVDVSLACHAVF